MLGNGALRWIAIGAAALVGLLASGIWVLQAADARGYARRDAQAREERAREEIEAARIHAAGLSDAAARNAALLDQLEAHKRVNARLSARLSDHLKAQEAAHLDNCNDPQTSPVQGAVRQRPLLGAAVLDEHTVRLLDDARAGRDPQAPGGAAGRADEEVGTAAAVAPITGAEFAANDLSVVHQYHQLARRHDMLVDWVYAQCAAP